MSTARFVYAWQYRIDPDCRKEFLAAYGPGGDWVRLFSSDPAYLGTRLLRDVDDDCRYLTIDYWKSKTDRDAFRARHAGEFAALDRRCETFTREETLLGDFEEI